MNEEIKETAKATQEIAKTAKTAIEATQQLGRFISSLVSEPFKEIVGILTDKLKFIRWERQVRLSDKIKEIIEKRGLQQFRVIPPKFALPLIEAASIEENDELQDLWAKLLITSIDPSKEFPRQGFIDILKQLEAIDVKMLKEIYNDYITNKSEGNLDPDDPTQYPIYSPRLFYDFQIKEKYSAKIFYSAIDNLMRMRLVTYHFWEKRIETDEGYDYATLVPGYYSISITSLGLEFVEACMKE